MQHNKSLIDENRKLKAENNALRAVLSEQIAMAKKRVAARELMNHEGGS